MLKLLYQRDFFRARAETYAILAVYVAIMMFVDPFSYACSAANPCPGCGFRTGVRLLLTGDIAQGLASNPLVGPTVFLTATAILDLLTGLSRQRCAYRLHQGVNHRS